MAKNEVVERFEEGDEWYIPAEPADKGKFSIDAVYGLDDFLDILQFQIHSLSIDGQYPNALSVMENWEKRILDLMAQDEDHSGYQVAFEQDNDGVVRMYFLIIPSELR